MELKEVYTAHCPDQIYDRHCHTHYEIIYVVEGSVNINLEGVHYVLEQGMSVLIAPLCYHIVTGNDTVYHRLIIDFTQDEIPEDLCEGLSVRLCSQAVFPSSLLQQMYLYHRQYDRKHEPLLNAVFIQSLYEMVFSPDEITALPQKRRSKLLQDIITYVDANLEKNISLQELAEQFFASESTLCHQFKEEMKIPLKQYILRKKMMYAKSLILAGTSPGEAAVACGYKNYASFYKMFLKFTGQSPNGCSFAKKEI